MLLWQFNDTGNNKTYLGLHVTCLLFLPYFNQICFSLTNFHGSPNIKFHGNPSSGSHANIHVEKQTDRWADKNIIGAFQDYANALKIPERMYPRDVVQKSQEHSL
jgi:hypothetical protein